jgi:hypothetical protein
VEDQLFDSDDEPDAVPDDHSEIVKRPHLITVDELRAAGALDVPPAWRKSLGVERDLFSGLFADDDALSQNGQPTESDTDDDVSVSADELP